MTMEGVGLETRRIAAGILLEVGQGRAFADDLLPGRIEDLDARDRRFVHEIVFGTIRHRNTLDRILRAHVAGRTDPRVRWLLRSAVYQLVYLSKVPEHAVVDASVSLVKEVAEGAAGFANAVLRGVARDIAAKVPDASPEDRNAIPIREGYCRFRKPLLPSRRHALPTFLSLRHSHPEWLIHRWLPRFDPWGTEALCVANNRTPEIHLRVTIRAPSAGDAARSLEADGFPCERTDQGIVVAGGDIGGAEAFRRGWVVAQDRNAIRIGALLQPPAGASILDLCAAPGGKALQLAEAAGPSGRVVACDITEAKLERIREGAARTALGWIEARLVPDDPDRIDLGETFEWILVDAPCSNTGVLARRPEARWRLSPGDLPALAGLQRKLIAAAIRHLSPGGTLVYATCSIEPEENQGLLREVLTDERDLRRLEILSFLQHRDPGDGGFAMKLVRAARG
ncbi:MAG: hypothetical protein JXP34_16455 [Planctomycetes bacterium]|nr:hypothetical protein [Planctomycetota bacterium]